MRTALWLLSGLTASAAHADRLPIPADAPPAFVAECGSCHLPFPPALLAAGDWQRIMANLGKHYGDNATLDDQARQAITDFLIRNAGSGYRTEGANSASDGLPRLTATRWFRHKHDEVPNAVWKDKRVGSAANCGACHTRAETGSYRERDIRMPGGYRHEHD